MDDPRINHVVALAQQWAPRPITGRMQQHYDCCVSPQTIDDWIRQDEHREHWETFLRRRGKHPGRSANRLDG